MKICVAQTKPVKGDIEKNIVHHKKLIDLAASHGADLVVFPELSLTGYEPILAKELAAKPEDPRFDEFQQICDNKRIAIGVGMPIKNDQDINISMILFQPHKSRLLYSKKHLHTDEDPFFVSGLNFTSIQINDTDISLAICYEISVPEHAEAAFKSGSKIYIASVAKSVKGIDKAITRLSEVAREYAMTVLMSNCVGLCDGEECAGKTSVWNNKGLLIGQLNGTNEGVLVFDTDTGEVAEE